MSKNQTKRNILIPSNDYANTFLKQVLGIKGRTRKSKEEDEEAVPVVQNDDSSESDEDEDLSEEEDSD